MPFRLKEAVYRIKCRAPGCRFVSDCVVRENIMGATEADVDVEVLKIARNLAYIKHDSLHGRKHDLANPDIMKMSCKYERLGTVLNPSPPIRSRASATSAVPR